MDFIITFFRDVLDGPLYIVICVINSILICSCIGYLGEQYLNKKKNATTYTTTYASVGTDVGVIPVPGATVAQPAAGVQPQAGIPTQGNQGQ